MEGSEDRMGGAPCLLSVIIIAQDEEDRIRRCLESVKAIADEIIVLDSGSLDQTVGIANEYTKAVFETDWPGYGKQKQRALEKAKGEWVLSIDADEALTPELAEEIVQVLQSKPEAVAFKLPWAVTIFGKRLDYGNSARAPTRLFRREGAKFSDAAVHETIIVPGGKVRKLKGRLTHYSIRDFEHYLIKNRTYSWLGAKKRFEEGKHGGGLPGAAFRAAWMFFRTYILRLGFLDGGVGFLVACMYAQSAFNKYAGLWTLRREHKQNQS